jgi:hypothetical protein
MKKTLAIAENNRKGNHKSGGLVPECGLCKAILADLPQAERVGHALLSLQQRISEVWSEPQRIATLPL